MLVDQSATPAPYNMTKPQELPPFGLDDLKRPCAVADDHEDRNDNERVAGKPLTIRESATEPGRGS